jgi:hypothetical protein
MVLAVMTMMMMMMMMMMEVLPMVFLDGLVED